MRRKDKSCYLLDGVTEDWRAEAGEGQRGTGEAVARGHSGTAEE